MVIRLGKSKSLFNETMDSFGKPFDSVVSVPLLWLMRNPTMQPIVYPVTCFIFTLHVNGVSVTVWRWKKAFW